MNTQFTINGVELKTALEQIQSSVGNSRDGAGNVLFCFKDNKLTLMSNDNTLFQESQAVSVTNEVNANNFVLNFSQSKKVIDSLSKRSGDISFFFEKNDVILNAGRSKYTLHTIDVKTFPRVFEHENAAKLVFKKDEIFNRLTAVRKFTATEDVRYFLNGIFLQVNKHNEKKLTLVGTNGHVMCLGSAGISSSSGNLELESIVPNKSVDAVLAFIKKLNSTEVTLHLGNHSLKVEDPQTNRVLLTKLIDGRYPEWRKVVPEPKKVQHNVEVNREELLNISLTLVSVANEKTPVAKLIFEGPELVVLSSSPDIGNGKEVIDTTGYLSDSTTEVGVALNYTQHALSTLEGDSVCLGISGPHDAIRVSGKNDAIMVVIMPVRL